MYPQVIQFETREREFKRELQVIRQREEARAEARDLTAPRTTDYPLPLVRTEAPAAEGARNS